jgi:hypothetical protein
MKVLKWYGLNHNKLLTKALLSKALQDLMNKDCSMVPVQVFLNDHKAQTLDNAVKAVGAFKN